MDLDCLFINAAIIKLLNKIYQQNISIETPTWALLLAESCRSKGYKVGIIDAEAERLTDIDLKKRLIFSILKLSYS